MDGRRYESTMDGLANFGSICDQITRRYGKGETAARTCSYESQSMEKSGCEFASFVIDRTDRVVEKALRIVIEPIKRSIFQFPSETRPRRFEMASDHSSFPPLPLEAHVAGKQDR